MKSFITNKITLFTLLLLVGLISSSCTPQAPVARSLAEFNQEQSGSDGTDNDNIITSGIGELNFFQQGQTKTTSNLNLFSDFTNSFLMRGDNIHNFLRIPNSDTQSLCLALNFPQALGVNAKGLLILSARKQSIINQDLGGREYYLQLWPNNESQNLSDCFNSTLTTSLHEDFGTNQISYKLQDVCPDCLGSISSSSIQFYQRNGVTISQVNVQALALTLMPALGSSSPSDQVVGCSSDAYCKVEGFNCCLNNQCVNHGEVCSTVDQSSPEYLAALEQVLARPQMIANYQNFFYVCAEILPTIPDNTGDDPNLDPDQQAQDLFSELEDLYNCLNPIKDEFSICSLSALIEIENIGNGGTTLSASSDDITFSDINSQLSYNNIVEVQYAGQSVFRSDFFDHKAQIAAFPGVSLNAKNDNLTVGQSATVDRTIPSTAKTDEMKIYYRVDGTCERLGSELARCEKIYKQGQQTLPTARSSDHNVSDQVFRLPNYANLSLNVLVRVGDVVIPPGSETWQLNTSSKSVEFSSAMPIRNQQDVKISYFVTDSDANSLLQSREVAQARVDHHCKCDPDLGCNLNPVYNQSEVVAYECLYYPPNTPEPPLQKTVYLSSKSVPHRYFDKDGIHYDHDKIGQGQEQEGKAFNYIQQNSLRPNNQNEYIGFNEIYGSFNRDEISAMPATVVSLESGKTYDLFVDSGSFSSCLNCGTDYFSNLQKLFPNNFLHKGGGYQPDMVESRMLENQGQFSSLIKYGRACFVPATMIPWTHRAYDNVQTQRLQRLKAQHFMFANGYQRDWYGFDYGSLIGSFDGAKWFSVGNQRRVQARGNKLFLAINAYFGDLTIDNTFQVTVNEINPIINSGSEVEHDTESDGAECQKAHYCSTDRDCITQLGYEYTCQNVSSIYTSWPLFDTNGEEQSGETIASLLSLVGGSNGQAKRCVYRGSGSLCSQHLTSVNENNSYAQSSNIGINACSSNHFCSPLTNNDFNDRIARYGQTPNNQNNQSYITSSVGASDTFGLGARLIGRPFDFYGDKGADSELRDQLAHNNAYAMCVPGKAPQNAATIAQLNSSRPAPRKADKAMGIGLTFESHIAQDHFYYGACPATDANGNYIPINSDLNTITNDRTEKLNVYASTQNLSSNALDMPIFDVLNLFNDEFALMTGLGHQKNACLRAPGASCFTDLDCAPNRIQSQRIRTLGTLSESELNSAELAFWSEELVCSNSQQRYLPGSLYPTPSYDLTTHKCCREVGRNFTYKSEKHTESHFKTVEVQGDTPSGDILLPGINQDIHSPERYSRTHTVYDKLMTESGRYPPLYVPGTESSTSAVEYSSINQLLQYNTLHLNNSRMCCTDNWVRNLASGGHRFSGQTQQNIPVITFRAANWYSNTDPGPDFYDGVNWDADLAFLCTLNDYLTSYCEIKDFTPGGLAERKYLDWFAKFELLGIPQVMIETNDTVYREVSEAFVDHDPSNGFNYPYGQMDISANKKPFLNTIKDVADGGKVDAIVNGVNEYYSAANYDNFDGSLHQVFSEDSFSCCIPTGISIDPNTPDTNCCTGQANTFENGETQCCLNDYADVSVYTNRYVSSEGANINGMPINDSDIDPLTGYIRTEVVLEIAAQMCCSRTAATGVVIGDYLVPMDGGQLENAFTRRFIQDSDKDNHTGRVGQYDKGRKWNNHVYCVPPGTVPGSGSGGSGGGAVEN